MGYETPTPIQERAIPVVLEGRDVLGIAQTGTGKTAAFALPVLHRLLGKPGKGVRVLVVAPTRELAEQIHQNFSELGRHTPFRSVAVYGGVGMQPQVDRLKSAQIVVACPGRLLDHLTRGSVDLSKVEALVLDEADRMFDMGFLPDIRKIVKRLPAVRQNLLFSATMPDAIRHLAHEVLTNPATIKVDAEVMACTVSHALYPVRQEQKLPLLMSLLKNTDTGSVLVFTRTKHRASRVAEKLLKEGYKAAALQGNLSQNRRQAALSGFRDGTVQILVATDIAARGIDVATVSHVINFDMPNTVEDYAHRTGRTGRACRTGDAFSMITPDDETLVRGIEKLLATRIERRQVEGLDLPAAAPEAWETRSATQRNRGRQSPGQPAHKGRAATGNNARRASGRRPSHASSGARAA